MPWAHAVPRSRRRVPLCSLPNAGLSPDCSPPCRRLSALARVPPTGRDPAAPAGSNAEGQLCLGQGSPRWTGTPLAVPGGPYMEVTAGTYFTCLLLAGGSARCCGSNPHGELGDGSRRASPAAVPSAPALKLAQISAGATHVCGIEEATSRAFCWG